MRGRNQPAYVVDLKRSVHDQIKPLIYETAAGYKLRSRSKEIPSVFDIEDSLGLDRPGNWKLSDLAYIADTLGMTVKITFEPTDEKTAK